MLKQKKNSPHLNKAVVMCFVMVAMTLFGLKISGKGGGAVLSATSLVQRAGLRKLTKPFCQSWSATDANNRSLQPFDQWHTHHPHWIVTSESEEEFCVEPAGKSPIIRDMMLLYANQFLSSCKLVHTRYQWGSGWSADFWNINLGLVHGLYYRVPCIITNWEENDPHIGFERTHPWNYAANKKDYGQENQTSLVCEAGDTTCYFLPYHGCGPIDELKNDSSIKLLQYEEGNKGGDVSIWTDEGWSAYSFVSRKQLWFRRAVFDYKEMFKRENNWSEKSDCTVMHVRRADAIFERHYYPVAFYVEMIPEEKLNDPNHYVFLLTDDSSAIEEAHEFFPNIKWAYFNRPRHNITSSGWEDHTPSGDPALEVIAIMSAFDLVQDCSTLIHGPTGFMNYIYAYMLRSGQHINLTKYDMGSTASANRMNAVPLNESVPLLMKILEEMRINKTAAQKFSEAN
ncbi:hypothetical protein ACHAW5_004580 [Stephanodiscus triporus]|uniref:Fucosyltransferase n=1 Tax=Stephanodiscus triporus TaxID=2934178 RepID=A0ABD3NXP5_9STRA